MSRKWRAVTAGNRGAVPAKNITQCARVQAQRKTISTSTKSEDRECCTPGVNNPTEGT